MRNKRVFMLMIGMILFIAVIGYSISGRADLSMPEKMVKDVSSFVQQWFYKPAGQVAGFFKDIKELKQLHEENERLRLLAAAYARDKVEYNFLEKENRRLQEDLNFIERQKKVNDYQYLVAQVVGVSNDANNRSFNIDLGSKQGIKRNMAVITTDGLIGLVSSVAPHTSTVTPITELDENSPVFNSITATIMGREDESFGILSGFDKNTGRLFMTKIAEDDKMEVGDTVITSGLGRVYPRGLVVGTVESKQVGDFGLTYTANVKMAANVDHLTEVFVVKVPEMEDAEE